MSGNIQSLVVAKYSVGRKGSELRVTICLKRDFSLGTKINLIALMVRDIF